MTSGIKGERLSLEERQERIDKISAELASTRATIKALKAVDRYDLRLPDLRKKVMFLCARITLLKNWDKHLDRCNSKVEATRTRRFSEASEQLAKLESDYNTKKLNAVERSELRKRIHRLKSQVMMLRRLILERREEEDKGAAGVSG